MAKKLTNAMADRDGGLIFDAGKLTVGEYLERWLADSVKGSVKEATYANYGHFARKHICPALGRVKLKNLTPAHVRSFYGEKSRSGLSAATVKKMHVVLHRALSQAVTDGLIPRNAAHCVRTPRVSAPGEEIKPLNLEECAAFLRAARGERLEALYVLALHCGLREGELLALRWEDADLDSNKPALHVRRTLTRGEDGRGFVIGSSTKSGRGRRVRLTQRAVAALKDHRKRQLEERMRLAGLWQDRDLIFPNETGSIFNPSNLRNRSFKRIKERSGVREDLCFHDLTAGCDDIDLRTRCMHKRLSNFSAKPSVCTHHAIRVNHTEIRCQAYLRHPAPERGCQREGGLRD